MKTACNLCPHHCTLEEGQTGLCHARANRNGMVTSINYGKLTSMALDPIEKKPLRRFHAGSKLLSVGSFGCNLHCPFCQNSDISTADVHFHATDVPPELLVQKALELQARGNIGIAYTYNEPMVGYEYMRDCSRLAHKAGLLNVAVTNGMICETPLAELLPFLDALNIDLKGFTQRFYNYVGGDLETVKTTIRLSAKRCHVEVTTLIIPGLNDSEEEMATGTRWLASLSPHLPLHITRFFPRYRLLDRPATPVETLYRLRDVAKRHLQYVYTGNC